MFNCDRIGRVGGGVALYVKSSLSPILRNFPAVHNIESLFIELKDKENKKLIIGIVYRPPHQELCYDKNLSNLISNLCNSNDAIILGDFNLPCKEWGGPLLYNSGRFLYESLLESSLSQLVNEPTRDGNILDLILSTDPNLIKNLKISDLLNGSDHLGLEFDIAINSSTSESSTKVINFSKTNFNGLRVALKSHNWSSLYEKTDIQDAWVEFFSQFKELTEQFISYKEKNNNCTTKPKWWNANIGESINSKRKMWNLFQHTGNINYKFKFQKLRRESKKMIKKCKHKLEAEIVSKIKSNPKEFYSYVNKKRLSKPTVGPFIDNINNEVISDNSAKAEILNNFFSSVFTVEDCSEIPAATPMIDSNTKLGDITITDSDIIEQLRTIKPSSSPGPDLIHPRILKEVGESIINPLKYIFNLSLFTGNVPISWKCANVTAIYKKGDKSLPSNYRPISLTSIICRLLEKIIKVKLTKFLEVNNIITESQHGFRNKRSCLTNLLDFFNDIVNLYDTSRCADVIYFDLQKAFDKVPHERLKAKLKAHGINGNVLNWISSWLRDRRQRVVVNGSTSEYLPVTSGVPQGSVLGPTLFLIYINDLDIGICNTLSKFADDTKLGGNASTDLDRASMQRDINTLLEWSEKWLMNFNTSKCKSLHIGRNNIKTNYFMRDTPIDTSSVEKDLGVLISDDLKTTKQSIESVNKANKILGLIGRTLDLKSETSILTLYSTLVRPHLEYCVQFWSPSLRKDIDRIEKVQRRATKMIPRLRSKPYEDRLAHLNLYSLSKRRLRGDLIETFKICKGLENVNCNKYFDIAVDERTRGHQFKIRPKHFSYDEKKNFFFNRVINNWNDLPANVIESETLDTFKKRLDKYMKSTERLNPYSM